MNRFFYISIIFPLFPLHLCKKYAYFAFFFHPNEKIVLFLALLKSYL